jgi:hypothetical protein
MKHLDRLREKTENFLDRDCQNCQKGGFGSFGSPTLEGAEVFSPPPDATIADRYPSDELGEPCPAADDALEVLVRALQRLAAGDGPWRIAARRRHAAN